MNEKIERTSKTIAQHYIMNKDENWKDLTFEALDNIFREQINSETDEELLAQEIVDYAEENLSFFVAENISLILKKNGYRDTNEIEQITESFHKVFMNYVKIMSGQIADSAIDAVRDSETYNKDPYSYYGVRRDDF